MAWWALCRRICQALAVPGLFQNAYVMWKILEGWKQLQPSQPDGGFYTFVKNEFSDPAKVQDDWDQHRNDTKSEHWRKALKEGCHERERAQCIVSPQVWIDISHTWTGPLALRWWHHSVYAAQSSMTYGILAVICHCLLSYNHFASIQIASVQADHLQTRTPLANFHEVQLSSMHLMTLAQPVAHITVEEMWRTWWKRETIGTLKEARCHSWKIVFKEMILFSLMYPPFWFSML